MGIALMPYVPDKFIVRGIENRMKRYSQLDHTKGAAQMTARLRHG
jgi:hypothetical protein